MPSLTVLVVDDEIALLKATVKTIKYADHVVYGASNLNDALALSEEHSFDVVVLDLMMPGADGLQVLARIRKIQPMVKSIIISGKLDVSTDEAIFTDQLKQQVEADIYLHKPLTATKIREALETVTQESKVSDWKVIAKTLIIPEKTSIGAAKKAAKTLKKSRKK